MSEGHAFLKRAIVALAAIGVVLPQVQILAGEQNLPSKPAAKATATNSIHDIKLSKEGTFTGRTVDQSGAAIEGAKVVVKQGNTQVAETVTDAKGNFSVKNMKTGVYHVSSGSTDGTFRLWTEQTAPPTAKQNGLLVMGANGSRGQTGGFNPGPLIVVAGVTGATVGTAAGIAATSGKPTPPSAPASN